MTAPQPPVGPPHARPARPPAGHTAGPASVPNQQFAPPVSPGAPAPPTSPGDPVPAPGRQGRLATLVAFVAVLFALLAAGVAGWAVHRANVAVAATDRLTDRFAQPPTPTAAPTGPAPAGSDQAAAQEPTSDSGITTEPTLDPRAVYDVKYKKRVLTAQVSYSDYRYIDLDAPRVDDRDGADVNLSNGNTSGSFYITFAEGAAAASADDPETTPNECAEKLQYSPLAPGDRYTFRQGDVFCVKTSLAGAEARADNQRIVVLEIKSVATDDTVSLSSTAWDVPR